MEFRSDRLADYTLNLWSAPDLNWWKVCSGRAMEMLENLKASLQTPQPHSKTLSTIKFKDGGTTPLIWKQINMKVFFWIEGQLANTLRFWVCDSIKGFQRIRKVCSALHCSVLFFWRLRNGHVTLGFHWGELQFNLSWGALSNLLYIARNNRFLYTPWLSNIFRVYHKQESNHVGFNSLKNGMLVQSFMWIIFLYCLHMIRSLPLSVGWGVVNTSSGESSFSTCQGPIGQIGILVPMDLQSRMGEVGSL